MFKKLTNNSLKNYQLCLSTPALSWDAMFNMTKVKLEIIPDIDMYFFFEKDMRG